MWKDVGNGFIFIIFVIVVISIASIVWSRLLNIFYYKYIDDSNYTDLKDDFERLNFYTNFLLGVPIITLVIIVLWVRFVRLSFIVLAGLFCLINVLFGAGALSTNLHLTRKINKKIIII